MSARASRLRLEDELRRIIDQEEALNRDVNGLLQDGATKAVPNGHHAAGAQQATPGTREGEAKKGHDGDAEMVARGGGGGGGLEQCLAELSRAVPDFPGLEDKAGALLAQIEDGHGMAEHVSRSVRRLDAIQMRVQRALALVEDVINLRGCAEGVRGAIRVGDLGGAASYVRRFREIDAGALADSTEMVEMDEAVKGLSAAVMERFETAVLDMDEQGIAAACPLLAPLGLAAQGQELYLGFARRALEAELEAGVGEESSPATQRLPSIYNVAAAFLRRQVPVAAAGLAPCLGDVALVRVVTKECGDRAATVLETFLREKSVASWASAELGRWGDQDGAGGGGGGGGGGMGDGGAEAGGVGGAVGGAGAEALGQADAVLEELAVLTQHTESYDRFVRFLVEEVESAHPSDGEVAEAEGKRGGAARGAGGLSGSGGGGGRPRVLPAPITEAIMPMRTRLQEAGAEVAVYYSQIEGQV
ncbi:unnamed protein product, partial [Laminaria digitata]